MKNQTEINVIDLFCGCGGMSFGFLSAGYKVLAGIDNDTAALETFSFNHPNAKTICGDIRNITGKNIAKQIKLSKVDVIVGGPPCQGLSLSGPRNFHDPRNRLFLSFIKITNELKPKAFILENVPGLIGLYKGKIKDAIINEFTKIGYCVSIQLLIAADYGVPQIRKRVFFVGLRTAGMKFSFPLPTHFNNNLITGTEKNKYVTCEDAISDLPPLDNGLRLEKQNYFSPAQNVYQKVMRTRSKYVYNHIGTDHTERVKKIIGLVPEGGNYKDLPDEYKHTRNFHIAWTRYDSKKPAATIDTGHRHHFHYKYNRVPTVRENARLQSFPDKFIFMGNKSEQYRQVGNAVPPLVAEAIAKELLGYL